MTVLFNNLFVRVPAGPIEGIADSKPSDIGPIFQSGINDVEESITAEEAFSLLSGEVYVGTAHFLSLEHLYYTVDRLGTEAMKHTLELRLAAFKETLGENGVLLHFGDPTKWQGAMNSNQLNIYTTLKENRQAFMDYLHAHGITTIDPTDLI